RRDGARRRYLPARARGDRRRGRERRGVALDPQRHSHHDAGAPWELRAKGSLAQGDGARRAVGRVRAVGTRVRLRRRVADHARRALEHSLAYCAERRQFGRPLREFQAVQFKLADMATRIEAARALAHAAATRRDRGEDTTMQASMAKLFASETAMWVTTQAVQLFGGYGYMRDFPVEKLFRDAKVTELYEGTSEIQRIIVARGLYPRA